MSEIKQCDKDRGNELRQKLGTLAEDFRALAGPKPSITETMIFDDACYKLAVHLFAEHRQAAEKGESGE
jgi:hypothetical protein